MQYVLGVRADVPTGTLVWDVRQLERHGIRGYPFGGGVVSLEAGARSSLAEEPVVRVTSTVPLRVRLRWGCAATSVGGVPPPDRVAAAAQRRERVIEATLAPALLPVGPAFGRPDAPTAAAAASSVVGSASTGGAAALPAFSGPPIDLISRLPPASLLGIDVPSVPGPLTAATVGHWTACEGGFVSPRLPRAVIELEAAPPAGGYRLTLLAEPLEAPNALVLPLALGTARFVAVLGLQSGGDFVSGLEAVHGLDVGSPGNPTRRAAGLSPFAVGRRSLVAVDVRPASISVAVDGECVTLWEGGVAALSMQWWWQTPRPCIAVGALDCAFRITEVRVQALA